MQILQDEEQTEFALVTLYNLSKRTKTFGGANYRQSGAGGQFSRLSIMNFRAFGTNHENH